MRHFWLSSMLLVGVISTSSLASHVSTPVSPPLPASGTLVQWDPPSVELTIGNGSGPTEEVTVSVESPMNLTNVGIWIPPVLRDFVEVRPAHFDHMQSGIAYPVHLRFSVAPNASAGEYSGALYLMLTRPNQVLRPLHVMLKVDYGDIVIPPTTRALSGSAAQALTSITATPDGRVLVFSTVSSEITSLEPGDVLVLNVCDAAPGGFLGRVVDVTVQGGSVGVLTAPATLEDAISEGTITLSETLEPEDIVAARSDAREAATTADQPGMLTFQAENLVIYDADGDLSTEGDQIRADGSIGVAKSYGFTLGLDATGISHLSFVDKTTEQAELTFHVDVPIVDLEAEAPIGQPVYFKPIVVWAGYVPVVLLPQLRVYAEVEGSATAGIETTLIQQAELTLGLQYNHGTWSPVADFTSEFDWKRPQFTLDCEVKAHAGPQFSLLLYGLVGPFTEAQGFVELDVDLVTPPLWQLYGGVEAGAGVRVDVLGKTIADKEYPTLIGFNVLLAQAETAFGAIAGTVTDAVTHLPLSGVSVDVENAQGRLVTTGMTDAQGTYSVSAAPGDYSVLFAKTGYLTVNYFGVTVAENETTNLEPVLQIDESHGGEGDVSGYILNALSGAGVANITVLLRTGMGSTAGPVVAGAISEGDGSYLFSDLDSGNYTAEIGGVGYVTTYFTVVCIGGQETSDQNATITPIIPPGETRIVLTWGPTPPDLDSHTTGPLPDGSKFHMFYPLADANAGSPWPEYVTLDLDDVTSYGPETTTLHQQIAGTYRFSVHDYTNRLSRQSTALSGSGAQVRVYRNEGLVTTFYVPAGQEGTLWTVFEMTGDEITPLNVLTYESDPDAIELLAPGGEFDWRFDLPPKQQSIPSGQP